MALPAHARFCARCGTRLRADAPAPPPPRRAGAPVWVLALLWLAAACLLWVAVSYAVLAAGLAPPGTVSAADLATLRGSSTLIAACALSLSAAHLVAALGLMGSRPWARTLATLVCVLWALTCIGLPVGLLAINSLWRARRAPGPPGPASTPRPSS